MPNFIGLDLAWSAHKESGVCWLEGTSRDDLRCTKLALDVWEMSALGDEVAAVVGPVVVTIDAPVLYSAERDVEREIGRQFGKYKASAHSAHAAVKRGFTAGIDLGRSLDEHGFRLYPTELLNGGRDGRHAVEVYPHTIHVRLFNLCERILYKKGRVHVRRKGMLEYQVHLGNLLDRVAPRVLECSEVQRLLHPQTVLDARGRNLKRLDDTLDGLTCALAAFLLWDEPDQWELLGDRNGYIVVPRCSPSPSAFAGGGAGISPLPEGQVETNALIPSPSGRGLG